MEKARRRAIGVAVGVPILVLLLVLTRDMWSALVESSAYPSCAFHEATGLLCPACGNTRAILALFYGHPLLSIGYNPDIMLLCLVGLLVYGEQVIYAVSGKRVHLFPHKWVLFYIALGLWLLYAVLRNIFPALTLCT